MATPSKSTAVPENPTDEGVRILALLLRYQLGSQSKAILELSRSGFTPARIAALLGTTPNTVSQEIAKAKRAKRKPAEKRTLPDGD